MSEKNYSYGYDVINVDGVNVPTLTFGGGNVRVTDGWEDGADLHGVLFSISDEPCEIGEYINPELEGKGFDFIPDIKMFMRFDKVESIDVVIGKLEACKKKMLSK